jgi:hypothetical integral membrane protein (TIGR02206 family)
MEVVGHSFTPYGAGHWLMLAVTAVGAVVVVLVGRRLRGTDALRALSRALAVALFVITCANLAVGFLPGSFSLSQSLPLQLSDILRLVAAYALWSWGRWSFALTYYWGLTLNVQSLITPNLHYRWNPSYEFTAYFATHILVQWAALFLPWGVGLRPDWSSYRRAVLTTIGWAAVAFGFNAATGTNYGFLNRKPSSPSLLDVMGGWPWYLLVGCAAMIVIWGLITWPWTTRDRPLRPAPTGTPASPG